MLPLLAAVALSVQSEYPFHYAGTMSKLLAPSAKLAPVTQGIPFELVLKKDGTIGPDAFKLAAQNWKGSANLNFADLKFANGSLTGSASLANAVGTSLQGLRLDVVSATELYRAKDKDGKDVTLTRSQAFQVDPLFFGDLLNKEAEGPLPFTVSNLRFAPESVQINIKGVLSGLRHVDTLEGPGGQSYSSMEFAGGKLYGEIYGRELFVSDAAAAPKQFAETEEQVTGIAVNPKTGDVYYTLVSNMAVYIITPAGAKKGIIGEQDGIEKYVQKPRFDKAGRLYLSGDGGSIYVLEGGKVKKHIEEIAGAGISLSGYDVAADGTIWITDGENVRMQPPTGAGRVIADTADWHFGNVQAPLGIRVSPTGLVYVGEEEVEGKDHWDRVSVFDSQGRIVRIFGRAAKKPLPTDEELLHPGQVEAPREIAFGPDGLVYIASASGIIRYQPF